MNKICSKCKIKKELSEFYKRNQSGIDGFYSLCKKRRQKNEIIKIKKIIQKKEKN